MDQLEITLLSTRVGRAPQEWDPADPALRKTDPPKRLRVLIAEGETNAGNTLFATLVVLGCEALIARTGLEAMRIAEEQRPDVIVLDGLLPGMHDFEVARFISDTDSRYPPRIVVVNASVGGTRDHYGIDQYLVRPLTANELGDAVFAPGYALDAS